MRYHSTNNRALSLSAAEAFIAGLAPDGGLLMPESFPQLPSGFFEAAGNRAFQETALAVLEPYLAGEMPRADLESLLRSAFDFPIPLKPLTEHISVLELFHGPTLAFKDFGARFLARAIAYFRRNENRELWVLVATSGDTGSAVASGFYRVPGTRVFVLYPRGKVSPLQEAQMTTLGENITALEIDGSFDDCQRLVKAAFVDNELRTQRALTSANSINLGRLLPQMLYYFHGLGQFRGSEHPVFVVPSGNLGNLAAGIFAQRMGLPIAHFVAATNRNDSLPEFLATGTFRPRPSVATVSNAMDVGDPSNMARLLQLFENSSAAMSKTITAYSFDDTATVATITSAHAELNYIFDPHGAVGLLGLKRYRQDHPEQAGIILETAHPAKFVETVEPAILGKVELPESLRACMEKKKNSRPLGSDFAGFKEFLLS